MNEQWIEQYERSHRHPVNRACHKVGIPAIALSFALAPVLIAKPRYWRLPAALFVGGWTLQFLGHAVEGKPPEFLRDYRFLFVGLRWWLRGFQSNPSERHS